MSYLDVPLKARGAIQKTLPHKGIVINDIRNFSFFVVVSKFRPGLHNIENWLGPHQNWLQSAYSKMRQKSHIDAHFQLFICIILGFFYAHLLAFLA